MTNSNLFLTRRHFLQLSALAGLSTFRPGWISAQSDSLPLIVDAHLDLGWNITNFGQDYSQSAAASPGVMVGLPELLAGQVALIVGSIFVIPASHATSSAQIARYTTPAEAATWGIQMLTDILVLCARAPQFRIIYQQVDLDAVLATWAPDQPAASRQIGILIGMEGADPIETPDYLQVWYDMGLRNVGLSWGKTQYAGSNSDPGGLTDSGITLLSEMSRLNMMFDTAHLSESAFWQAMDLWEKPVIYSHGTVRRYLPTERALTDDQISAITERSGVIGIGVYDGFYQQNLQSAQPSIIDLANAIDYICQYTGTSAHAAVGSDSDGGFTAQEAVINTIDDLQQLPALLTQKGYTSADIEAILNGNWLRVFRGVLPP